MGAGAGVSSVTQALWEPWPLHVYTQAETVELVSRAQTACIAGRGSFVFLQTLLRATETAAG